MIRRALGDADLERCVQIYDAVDPQHGIALDDLKASDGAFLLADGGYAALMDSSVPNWQYTMVRVRPEARRHGVGSALLDAAADEAGENGKEGIVGRVGCDDGGSRSWATARGFRETRQDIELLRQVGPGDGEIADGIVPLREEHLAGAYEVEAECVPDVPATVPMAASTFSRWRERIEGHAATFVALDGGRVVGFATLRRLHGTPHRLEHGLTAVLTGHRGRGLATKLKSAEIAWAAANGYRELITFTDTTNGPMRRVNVKLGYVETLGPIMVERELL